MKKMTVDWSKNDVNYHIITAGEKLTPYNYSRQELWSSHDKLKYKILIII